MSCERSDDELVNLIMERGDMDEPSAMKTLAHIRRGRLERAVYDRT